MERTAIELVRVVVALVVSALAFLQLVRWEWFDTLRWGPPNGSAATAYVAWAVFAGLVGWLVAAAATSRRLWRERSPGVLNTPPPPKGKEP